MTLPGQSNGELVTTTVLYARIPAELYAILKDTAQDRGVSLARHVGELLGAAVYEPKAIAPEQLAERARFEMALEAILLCGTLDRTAIAEKALEQRSSRP